MGPPQASAVESLALDPGDGARLAFHLRGGWSGVLHVGGGRGEVTHAFCPHETKRTDGNASVGYLRRGAWIASTGTFCVRPPPPCAMENWTRGLII